MTFKVVSNRGSRGRYVVEGVPFCCSEWEALKKLSRYREANPEYEWWLTDISGRRIEVGVTA